MSADIELPLNLYRVNQELQLRIARLFQESTRKWLELGKCVVDDSFIELSTEADQLLKARDWRTLTTLPGEAFWHQVLLGFGDADAAAKISQEAQMTFAAGLHDAIQAWQENVARILGEAGASYPFGAFWTDVLKRWSQFPHGASMAAPGPGKDAGGAARGT